MPEKYSFVYEPHAPVGNEFHEIWGEECPVERGCVACHLRLYHRYENDGKELHVWTGRVVIRAFEGYVGLMQSTIKEVVFHSDYTLDDLRSLSPNDSGYQHFINEVVKEKEPNG